MEANYKSQKVRGTTIDLSFLLISFCRALFLEIAGERSEVPASSGGRIDEREESPPDEIREAQGCPRYQSIVKN